MVFANLSYQDKQAFFALLDEYFESRPHLVGGGGGSANGGATISSGGANIHIPPAAAKAAAASVASAAVSQLGGGGGRSVPPPPAAGGPPPIHSSNRPSSSAPASSPSADSGGGVTSRISAFGGKSLNKFASNSHVSGAMGKVGAGGLADKWSRPAPSTSTSSSTPSLPPPRNNASPPQPPPSRRVAGAPVEGLQTQKSFGHVDMSSGAQAAKTMWRDPKSAAAQPPTANVQQSPAFQRMASDLPPPVRRAGAGGARQEDDDAHADAGQGPQAQALYDYEGGDDTDLPVSENQIVTIIAKTSDDWWTCEADGRQGLVPANYLKEL